MAKWVRSRFGTGPIAPGNSPGTLNTGSEIWDGGATYLWEISSSDGTPGEEWNWLNIQGTLTLNGNSTDRIIIEVVSLTSSGTPGAIDEFARGNSFTIATASGGILNFNADHFVIDTSGFANDPGSSKFTVVQSGNDLNLVYDAIPEPAALGPLSGAGVLLVMIRRRRKG